MLVLAKLKERACLVWTYLQQRLCRHARPRWSGLSQSDGNVPEARLVDYIVFGVFACVTQLGLAK